LIVTITDPIGRTTFKRSEYVAPDGTTAVGHGGGEILGTRAASSSVRHLRDELPPAMHGRPGKPTPDPL
jgi:hypothetical protein